MIDCFKALQSCIDLQKSGRMNSATATYRDLPEAFRVKILELVIYALKLENYEFRFKSIEIATPYGTLFLSKDPLEGHIRYNDLVTILPDIQMGASND